MTFDIGLLKIDQGQKANLAAQDPDATPGWSQGKAAGRKRLLEQNERLEQLQELVWAQGKERILVVLQAMDAGGKDGTISRVFEGVNPTGVKVASFKKPSDDELSRDYLWRIHQHVPANGELTIFNRSHYEDVLAVRVLNLVDEPAWRKRFSHIVNFEKMLSDEGTTIIKIFLNISKDEQKERLQARLDEPEKNWKFDPGDLDTRAMWDDYQEAFEDAITETTTDFAPWFVVPANRKWYRNLAISEILIQSLEALDMSLPAPADGLDKITII